MTHTRLVSHSGGQFPGTFYRLVPELGGENNAVLVLNTTLHLALASVTISPPTFSAG